MDGFTPTSRATYGCLAGFHLAGLGAGWQAARGQARTPRQVAATVAADHAVILVAGAAWLKHDRHLDVRETWEQGIQPFRPGAILKSARAAVIIPAGWRSVSTRRAWLRSKRHAERR